MPTKQRPTFHEIRGLSSHLYKQAGYKISAVQELMAHTDEKMTRHYQAGHETHWTEIDLNLPKEVLSRDF
jgi:integrase